MAIFKLLVLVLLGFVDASPLHHTVEKRKILHFYSSDLSSSLQKN